MTTSDAERAATRQALDRLQATLREAAIEFEHLADRAGALRAEVDTTAPMAKIMAAEPRPLLITAMTDVIDRLTDAASAVRRAEARQLQREGMSHQGIADIFGVTRQRVGALLAAAAEPRGRPFRPRRGA